MMRRGLIAVGMIAGLAAAPAAQRTRSAPQAEPAQAPPQPESPPQNAGRSIEPNPGPSTTHATDHDRALSQHIGACRKRYRTYDPRTDQFVAKPGVLRTCRL